MHIEDKVHLDSNQDIKLRVENLLSQMTLAEKIGQMTQVEKNSIQPEAVKEYAIGSVLSGGGGRPQINDAEHWAKMVGDYAEAALASRLGIPLIYGVDAVHGHGNLKGAVIFPHNIGLGATRDADLVERIAQVTAREILATGIHWNFAPAVSVPQDVRWGRTYEGYSENTDLVTELALAYMRGLQHPNLDDAIVLESVKHFVGDGATTWGTTKLMPWLSADNWQGATDSWKIDQGDARIDEATLREVHLAPYVAAIEAGAKNIMVSFSSWNGERMHAHKYLLTDVLKGEYAFAGFLVSDWMAIHQIDADFYVCVVKAINAGLDMIMTPYDYKAFISTLTKAVENGDVTQERIDDAVRRILRVKFELGLFEKSLADDAWLAQVGSEEHRAIAQEAVQKSAVLLKNDNNALPIDKNAAIFVAGLGANDIGLACGGWTIEWLGSTGAITEGTTLLQGLHSLTDGEIAYSAEGNFIGTANVGILVLAEHPYAEGNGDTENLHILPEEKALVEKVREHCETLILIMYSGRPRVITDIVDMCDAIVAAWLPGSEAAALADVLYGDVPFTGKLSFSWMRDMSQVPLAALKDSEDEPLYPFGQGLSL